MDKIIFIMGADHSGSTMVGCILGANKNPLKYFHTGELYAFFDPNKKIFGKTRGVKNLPFCGIWNDIDPKIGYKNSYKEIHKKVNPKMIIDSSKTMKNFNYVKNNKYPFHIVVTVRPFKKIWKSDENRNKSYSSIENNLLKYKKINDIIIKKGYNYTIINIENLILNPAVVTEKLCNKVGIPYFDGKENYWNFPSCHIFGSKTQREHLNNKDNAYFDKNKVYETPEIKRRFLNKRSTKKLEDFYLKNSI